MTLGSLGIKILETSGYLVKWRFMPWEPTFINFDQFSRFDGQIIRFSGKSQAFFVKLVINDHL